MSERSSSGVDSLGHHVEGQRDDIDVARPLAVAEEGSLDTVGARHAGELGSRHRGPPVVVGMKRQDDRLPVPHGLQEPFDLVGVDVRGRHLHRRGEVEDGAVLRGGLPHVHDRLADLDGVVEFRSREALRRVLETPSVRIGGGFLQFPDQFRAVDGDLRDSVPVRPEDDAPLQSRRRVVEVDDRVPGALDRLEGAADQGIARLGENLDGDVPGHHLPFDELAAEIEVRLAGAGKSDLDLLEAHVHERAEHAPLAFGSHGFDQRLVAVPKIDAAPHGRLADHGARPSAVGQVDGLEGPVAAMGHRGHRRCSRGGKTRRFPDCHRVGECSVDMSFEEGCGGKAQHFDATPLGKGRRSG